eukprot:CAMPEP_0206142320 /NCGR_PEP_ID=MMETSP1473-20131121/16408_1 /ASSEMBLY_ACC=CAM_ASM_001109 /TAXON_ID=1461547 /ORGANISM="Stichococcus sp, Strain RCC1054" /LENGTH=371 /DNA_ID=CAMNT_0053537267 /DNA_START=253 /DNA_END=1364 /DNA_ORIENTATION=+
MAFEAGGQQHCDALSRSEDSTSDSHLDQHAQLPPGAAVKQHTASAESVPPSQPRSGNVGGELAAVLMPAKRRDDPRSQVQSPEEEPTTPPKPDVRPSPVHTNSEDTQPSATPAELDSPLESKSNELSEQSSLSADLPVSTSAPDLAAASASSSTPADDPASPDSEEALPLPPFTLHIDDGAELATVRPRAGSFLLVESMSATEVVLRLRPAAGQLPSVSGGPQASTAGGTATPGGQRSGEPDEAERGRPNITKEQLSAAQLAVQRSLRGLTGPDAAKTLEGDPSLASEGRALKRGSANMTNNLLSRPSSGCDHTHGRHSGNEMHSDREQGSNHASAVPGGSGVHPWLSPESTPSQSPRDRPPGRVPDGRQA